MPVPQQPFACQLLSEDENQRLIASLGAKCVANCAAVVCVYVPDGPTNWRQIHCGVATIEKDSFLKSYFFRVYDLVKFMRLHEETIFLEMGYTALTPNFHTFQGARFPVGLAFADTEEASAFRNYFGNLVSRWSRRLDTVTQNQKMPATNPKQPTSERPIACRLLTDDDKRRLRACLDAKCVVDCAAVVQVYAPGGTGSWRQLHSGVATIEEDSSLKSYFIRVYDLEKSSRVHEEAIFLEMEYTALTSNFHTLQGDRFPLGLAFADVAEASAFQSNFTSLLARWARQPTSMTSNCSLDKPNSTEINRMHVLEFPVAEPAKSGFSLSGFRKKPKKSVNISAPTNFRHVQHMGFNKDSKRFDMSVLDEDMLQKFFKDNNLHCLFNTAEDTEFAAQFIAKNIGIKKFNQAMKGRAPPPPVPAAAPTPCATPPVPSFPNRPTMPPPPVPTNSPRPHTHAPPPPPPVQSRPPLQGRVPPSMVPAGGPAPAPPPPPPPPAPQPPAPASNDRSDAADGASRPPAAPTDLQAQIHSFNKNTLRRVSDNPQPLEAVVVTGDSHKDLLAATLGEALNNLMSSRRAYLSDEDSSEDSDF
ncbi:hypothetical protein SprV_0100493700 [Sparganum proliferum]